MPNSGNTPNTVSALSSTYPTAPSQLILVEGGIPGQEGLRILPAAPVLPGWSLGLKAMRVAWLETTACVCIQCMCANACSFMTALGYSEAVVLSSQLSCQLTAILSLLQTAPLSLRETRPSEISAILRLGGWRGIGGYLACFFSLYMISFRGSDGNMAQTEQKETRLVLFTLEGIKRGIMWFNSRPYWYQDYFWTPHICWRDRSQHVGVSKPNAQSGGKCAWSLT